jgi:hypothetical protein
MMKALVMSAALALGLGLSTAAHADSVKAGTLTCNEKGGWGLILGSSRSLQCTFEQGDESERYDGKITKLGVDIGYKGSGVIIWGVIAPTSHVGPGALAGSYGGATASATAGVGVGAHALVGGSDKSITLQPLSVEGSTGLNVAAGVAGLTLTRHTGP